MKNKSSNGNGPDAQDRARDVLKSLMYQLQNDFLKQGGGAREGRDEGVLGHLFWRKR